MLQVDTMRVFPHGTYVCTLVSRRQPRTARIGVDICMRSIDRGRQAHSPGSVGDGFMTMCQDFCLGHLHLVYARCRATEQGASLVCAHRLRQALEGIP